MWSSFWVAVQVFSQHPWQQPKPLFPKEKVEAIIGPIETETPSRDLNIVWVYGYDNDHEPGNHDYVRIKDTFVNLLQDVPRVKVEEAFFFPTQTQFETADLLVMYLHLPSLKKKQFAQLQAFIEQGGGIVALHETAIMRPAKKGKRLSACLGMAWNDEESSWGAIYAPVIIQNDHPVFKGFPKTLNLVDEFYWDLFQEPAVDVLGRVPTGPEDDSEGPVGQAMLSKSLSPIMWTYEIGQGRVFGTTAGHNTFTYFDPEFRIILFRAMAWAIREQPGPFMPLVFEGITNEHGLVGTTQTFRDWKGKIRGDE